MRAPFTNRSFSLTWSAAVQISQDKMKFLYKPLSKWRPVNIFFYMYDN